MRKGLILIFALLLGCFGKLHAQSRSIVGTVSSLEDGLPIPGVTVIVKGTTLGTTTNVDGRYTLHVRSEHKVLVFSFMGMKTCELPISGSVLNVVMEPEAIGMDEVVITGYQEISKERATGSFSILSPQKLETKLQADLKSSLEGQISGLNIDKDGKIEIRGASSFNAVNEPLLVVDGYPYEGGLESLNLDNIANVTVLKDAVAASIYGARSGNGVIVVTTKKGRKGENKISYKGSYGIHLKPDLSYLNRASASDYLDAEMELFEKNAAAYADAYQNRYSEFSEANLLLTREYLGEISAEEMNENLKRLQANNALKEIEEHFLRTKIMQKHSLLVSQGGETNVFNLGLNYSSSKNELIDDDEERFIIDIKDQLDIGNRVKLNFLTGVYFLNTQKPNKSIETITDFGFEYIKPYTRLIDDNGKPLNVLTISPLLQEKFNSYDGLKDMSYYPIADLKESLIKSQSFRVKVGGDINVNLTEGLDFKLGYIFSKGFRHTKQLITTKSWNFRYLYNCTTDATDPSVHYIPDGDIVKERRDVYYDYTLRAQLNFRKDLFNNHNIVALLGAEKRKNYLDGNRIENRYGYNSISGDFMLVNNKNLVERAYSFLKYTSFDKSEFGQYSYLDNRYVSFFGNASYEIDQKYILSGSVRIDQSNLFGTDPKYKYTPLWSLGLTYKIGREDFFKLPFFNDLQVRASYGVNGNVARDNGPFLLVRSDEFSNSTGEISYEIVSPPNKSLRWEKTKTYNFGLDASLCNNKVDITLDAYVKKSTDLLAYDNIDPTYGFSLLMKNIGELNNTGVELSMNTRNLQTKNFTWQTNLILNYNKSHVVKSIAKNSYPGQYMYPWVIMQDYSLNPVFGYQFAGINNEGKTTIYNQNGEVILPWKALVGDQVYLGTSRPKYVASLTNRLQYHNFDLSFMFIYKAGHRIRKDAFTGSNYNHADVAKRWRKPGDENTTNIPKLEGWNMDMFYYPYMDINVINGAYLKLRDLTLSYNFSELLAEKVKLKNAKLYFQARNLFSITANKAGVDPETYELNASGGTGAMTAQSSRTLPIMPEYYIGLSLDF